MLRIFLDCPGNHAEQLKTFSELRGTHLITNKNFLRILSTVIIVNFMSLQHHWRKHVGIKDREVPTQGGIYETLNSILHFTRIDSCSGSTTGQVDAGHFEIWRSVPYNSALSLQYLYKPESDLRKNLIFCNSGLFCYRFVILPPFHYFNFSCVLKFILFFLSKLLVPLEGSMFLETYKICSTSIPS